MLAPGLRSCNFQSDLNPMFDPTPENDARGNRRHFLHVAGALTVGTTYGPNLLAARQSEAPAAAPQSSSPSEAG